MSIEHRNNPDSEECQRMARDNELAVKVAQHMAKPRCARCDEPMGVSDTGPICRDCQSDSDLEDTDE